MMEILKQNKELFDVFARREEYNPLFLDKFQRFPYYLSTNRTIFEPEVSKFLLKNGLKVEYPEGKKFAVCLTHDIDVVNLSKSSLFLNATKSLMEGKIKESLTMPFCNIYRKWNPWWNFKDIMAIEEKYEAKSSFFFLDLDKEEVDFNYKVEDLEAEIGNIIDNGWEVGVHGGHETYSNFDQVKKIKNRLERVSGKEVLGYRNHFLRFKIPDTFEILSKAGFKYDTTLGYADCAGFRNGMCHPFKPFNLNTNKEINILEIPLCIMDCTLFNYMKLDMIEAWNLTQLLIDTVENYNGVMTILWHNTYMKGENLKFYEKILKYCNEKNAWMVSGADIWKQQ